MEDAERSSRMPPTAPACTKLSAHASRFRFSYIDFIRYAWRCAWVKLLRLRLGNVLNHQTVYPRSALMVNQFEGQPGNTPTDAEGKVGFLGSPTVLEHFGIQVRSQRSSMSCDISESCAIPELSRPQLSSVHLVRGHGAEVGEHRFSRRVRQEGWPGLCSPFRVIFFIFFMLPHRFFWGFFFCAWMALKYKRTVSR